MFENTDIKKIRSKFEDLYKEGSIAGTWLLYGSEGVGKASFSLEMASFILSGGKYDDVFTNSMVGNNTHSDLLYIQRDYTETEKKDIIKILKSGKNDTEVDRKRNSEITVDDVRKIDDFIHLSSMTGWKVIIIDTCDDMNKNAANAVLKSIEEPPPKCVVFLISHQPAKLLPTILSRCKKIKFPDFGYDDVASVLVSKSVASDKAKLIACMSNGSVGRAISLSEMKAAEIFKDFIAIVNCYTDVDCLKVYELLGKYEKDDMAYAFLQDVFLNFLLKSAKFKSGFMDDLIWLSDDEHKAVCAVSAGNELEKLLNLYTKSVNLFNKIRVMYLDKKQVLVNCLLEV